MDLLIIIATLNIYTAILILNKTWVVRNSEKGGLGLVKKGWRAGRWVGAGSELNGRDPKELPNRAWQPGGGTRSRVDQLVSGLRLLNMKSKSWSQLSNTIYQVKASRW